MLRLSPKTAGSTPKPRFKRQHSLDSRARANSALYKADSAVYDDMKGHSRGRPTWARTEHGLRPPEISLQKQSPEVPSERGHASGLDRRRGEVRKPPSRPAAPPRRRRRSSAPKPPPPRGHGLSARVADPVPLGGRLIQGGHHAVLAPRLTAADAAAGGEHRRVTNTGFRRHTPNLSASGLGGRGGTGRITLFQGESKKPRPESGKTSSGKA